MISPLGECDNCCRDHSADERYRRVCSKCYGVLSDKTSMKNNGSSPLSQQIGGSHYKDFAIQPVEFIYRNSLGFCEGNVVKYICRYKSKGGIDDLKKSKHYIEMLIEMEEKNHE